MAYPNIEAILGEGGDITVGRVGPIECVASASTSSDCPVMLVRCKGESVVALLRRLDRAIAKAWEEEITIDKVICRRQIGNLGSNRGGEIFSLPILICMGAIQHGAGNLR